MDAASQVSVNSVNEIRLQEVFDYVLSGPKEHVYIVLIHMMQLSLHFRITLTARKIGSQFEGGLEMGGYLY